jgi:hypothetical protein
MTELTYPTLGATVASGHDTWGRPTILAHILKVNGVLDLGAYATITLDRPDTPLGPALVSAATELASKQGCWPDGYVLTNESAVPAPGQVAGLDSGGQLDHHVNQLNVWVANPRDVWLTTRRADRGRVEATERLGVTDPRRTSGLGRTLRLLAKSADLLRAAADG